jgi:hypothetical protein
MDKFEKKYGIKEDEKIKTFHMSRRMFCIYNDKLFIAKPNLPYSHAVWFLKKGWICEDKDDLMNTIIRGVINKGDIYFYIGYDFQINKKIELIFFKHLNELVKKLKIKPKTKIFGGLIKDISKTEWEPRKDYGEVKSNLKYK